MDTVNQNMGLGDKVERVAKPIAKGLKKLTGGKLDYTKCPKCQRRKEALNRLSKKFRG